jgi:hypothetical protein
LEDGMHNPAKRIEYLQKHPLMLGTLKPKAEVYKFSEMLDKCRNIIATPVTAQKLI